VVQVDAGVAALALDIELNAQGLAIWLDRQDVGAGDRTC
jgi:hypothetical protein